MEIGIFMTERMIGKMARMVKDFPGTPNPLFVRESFKETVGRWSYVWMLKT